MAGPPAGAGCAVARRRCGWGPIRQLAVRLAPFAATRACPSEAASRFSCRPAAPRALSPAGRSVEVIDVWEGTIDEEMTKLRKLVERFPFVAMVSSSLVTAGCAAGAQSLGRWPGARRGAARRRARALGCWPHARAHTRKHKLARLVLLRPRAAGCLPQDTSFPGIVARPLRPLSEGPAKLTARDVEEYHYQSIRLNVDVMPVLQVGLTLFDASGNMPPGGPVWQFNMRFDPTNDLASPFALDQMRRTGLDLERLSREGVPHSRLGEVLMVSGLVLVEGPKWVTFQSGYDMAFLLKVRTDAGSLPRGRAP